MRPTQLRCTQDTAKFLKQETWKAVVYKTQGFHSFTDCLPASPYYLDWADVSKKRVQYLNRNLQQ